MHAFDAVNKIGYPESQHHPFSMRHLPGFIAKKQCCSCSIGEACSCCKKTWRSACPLHIRNAPTRLMKNLGYGKNYEYSHSYENNFSPQEYLPKEIAGKKFYDPGKMQGKKN